MQTTSPKKLESPIPIPAVDSDGPVAVIPTASVAPLEGPPDGERINTFALAAEHSSMARERLAAGALGDLRARVLARPLASLATAFGLGLLMARLLR